MEVASSFLTGLIKNFIVHSQRSQSRLNSVENLSGSSLKHRD
jgi:hypothetical protein